VTKKVEFGLIDHPGKRRRFTPSVLLQLEGDRGKTHSKTKKKQKKENGNSNISATYIATNAEHEHR